MKTLYRLSLHFFLGFIFVFLPNCTSLDSTTRKSFDKVKTFKDLAEFQSPLESASKLYSLLTKEKLSKRDRKYISAQLNEILSAQGAVAKELMSTGKLELKPGHSYEFDLESFCVNVGMHQPLTGDGMYLNQMPSEYSSWLPSLLDKYKEKKMNQEDTQTLIWSLASESKYDELSEKNQSNMEKIFSDAPDKFSRVGCWREDKTFHRRSFADGSCRDA
ncbi:hypothetical protein [Bdellovibrio sp. HCB-162]|uniref:hypothetical protein n=1 Tax=Bdellovibrio sp. HCB-162 TaxID=3394234 RepID=UPI0039BCB3FD